MGEVENPKKQQILVTARSLFWKFGIKRVSVEEICREARVSKMTFYKYFNNKIDLAKNIFENMTFRSMAKYKNIMNQDIAFAEKVRKTIQLKMEQSDALSQEFFADFYKNGDPELKTFLNKKIEESLQIVTRDYIEAQKKGDIRSDVKPEFILYFLHHMIAMAKDEQLERIYNSPQEMIMELTNFFFYGILPRGNNH